MQVWDAVYHYTVVVPRIRWADTQCGGMFGHKHQYIRQDGVAEENSSTCIRMSERNESEGDEETREEEIKVRARKEVRSASQ
ncbi:hypothetical protein ALC57_01775 [Trachymyrmex cornetzi]|uniref:Uncharacterized protein n=1 Tax=Trachymyrmex cornetzi TaxID=471704 RepID=A0A195ELK4_9HYME|nr:hypothetical protein ALC57_01775 [Trachymyrmex cornetzi]